MQHIFDTLPDKDLDRLVAIHELNEQAINVDRGEIDINTASRHRNELLAQGFEKCGSFVVELSDSVVFRFHGAHHKCWLTSIIFQHKSSLFTNAYKKQTDTKKIKEDFTKRLSTANFSTATVRFDSEALDLFSLHRSKIDTLLNVKHTGGESLQTIYLTSVCRGKAIGT